MEAYDHATEITTRFRDLDTNRHVNNAVYVSYLEQGRAEYFADVLGVHLAEAEIVLARLELEFEAPVSLDDRVTVHTRVPELGRSSFAMEHAIEAGDRLAATATSTIVPFDVDSESARPIPDAWREAVRNHESLGR
ncbi:MAG: acyl-CoA thioesterase [Haloglomus sp.]